MAAPDSFCMDGMAHGRIDFAATVSLACNRIPLNFIILPFPPKNLSTPE